MKKAILFLYCNAIIFGGCSSKYIIKEDNNALDSLNYQFQNKRIEILFSDKSELTGDDIILKLDSVSVFESKEKIRKYYPLGKVHKLIHRDRVNGALEGLLIGTSTGTGLLTIYGAAHQENFLPDIFNNIAAASVSFGLIGAIIGSIGGHINEYQFVASKDTFETK